MENIRDRISKNLLYFRKKNHLTQFQLAQLLGVSHSAVSNWENGFNSIDIDTLFKACQIFGVTLNDMYAAEKQLSLREQQIVEHYRSHPQVQAAVDILLGLENPIID